VAVGLTLVEPLASVEVNVPGVMAMLVAPAVAQLNMLLDPELMLEGLEVNELIVGLLSVPTVTVAFAVVEPAAFVAVKVYVVVVVGLTLVEPLASVEVKVPGVIATLVAPLASQLRLVLAPAFMLAGSAPNEVIAGAELFPPPEPVELVKAQPTKLTAAINSTIAAQR
jgi:hypothetical protein